MQEVLSTSKRVAGMSRVVRLDRTALARFARRLADEDLSPPAWDPAYHFHDGGATTVSYLLVLDTLNFCFWSLPGRRRWEMDYEGTTLSGYIGLAAALKKALERRDPVTDAEFLSRCTLKDLKAILGGSGELLLMERRVKNLNELGRVLKEDYGGQAHRIVEAADGSAVGLARRVARGLASFRDISSYEGGQVYFYKRAQILAADLHGMFKGRKWGNFRDMDRLTTFADYKLPQVLRHLGILLYAPELAYKVDHEVLLEPGSPEEVEIRANTVVAVDLLSQHLSSLGKEFRAYEIDWLLWNMGQKEEYRKKPYHRTMTVFY